ncbi:hypothetical protein PALB_10510 [Pseudoalteromonas luteoviolacea B = ATCC 29581]|nr:hypothetical protein PALB_10510 [Pseudoalteromonas luteoviolacea B = ATCC 29581]
MYRHAALVSVMAYFITFGNPCRASDVTPYTINIAQSVESPLAQEEIKLLFKTIYSAVEITPEFVVLPSLRGLMLVNNGELDAEAGRVEQIGSQYHELIKVPTPLFSLSAGFYCLSKMRCNNIQEDTVIIVPKGSEVVIEYCKVHKLTCLAVNNDKSMFQALESGVGEVVLAADWIARMVMCYSSARTYYYRSEPELDLNIYHYLNKKHITIVGQLDDAIGVLKQSGELNFVKEIGLHRHLSCGVNIIDLASPPLSSE